MTDSPRPLTARLTRVFNAPIDVVYRAWTDAEQLVQWMKCEPSVEVSYENWHPEVGRKFATSMKKPGEWETHGTGRFLEVDPPHVLAYCSDANPELGVPEMTVRIELKEVDGGTELTLTHSGLPSDEMKGIVQGGWTQSLSMLGDLVAAVQRA